MIKLKKNDIFILVFLIISIFVVYAQVLNFDFINFDDNDYVTENEFVKNGITMNSVIWAFTRFHSGNWHPLTWISHMIDCQFFGLNAGWHHFTNLIFHLFNSLLLYLIFRKMTGNLWRSGFVAALFALHPLHVESVAWISERKDVLSSFWAMLTILSYLWFVKNKKIYPFLGVILFFSFGLMSKPMLVTLPFVLLLLDYWPLERFQFQHSFKSIYSENDSIPSLFLEKIPLFFLSLISCLITILAQQHGKAISSFDQIPFFQRVANAFVSYANYIYKTVYPVNLAILYPYEGYPQWWKITGSVLFIILISFFAIKTVKSHPYFIVGWLWFLGTLIPVIGFVQVGTQSMADRYTYFPLTGLFIIIAWGILPAWRHKKNLLFLSCFCLFSIYLMMSWQQTTYWKNGETISRKAIEATSGNWVMENNLANMLFRKGDYTNSIVHYIEAFRINPDGDTHYDNLMLALHKIRPGKSAAKRMEAAISLYPEEPALYFLVGKMYRDENRFEMAIRFFNRAIEMDDSFTLAYYELATVFMLKNELKTSIAVLENLVELQPDSPIPYIEIARTYQSLGNNKKASQWYQKAIEKGYVPLPNHISESRQ